jgi:hypothetical protein
MGVEWKGKVRCGAVGCGAVWHGMVLFQGFPMPNRIGRHLSVPPGARRSYDWLRSQPEVLRVSLGRTVPKGSRFPQGHAVGVRVDPGGSSLSLELIGDGCIIRVRLRTVSGQAHGLFRRILERWPA